MIVNTPSITEKKYKKLSLLVSLDGFSFSIVDTLDNKVHSYKEVKFDNADKSVPIEELFVGAFAENTLLGEKYDEIVVVHSNNLSTVVPAAMFDENYLGSYLQYSAKVFETDSFDFDEIPTYQMNMVYIPYAHINNFLIDRLGSFDYKHANTILVSRLLDASKNVDDKRMFVHFNPGHFEIVVVQNQHLLLFNSFEYSTPEDLIYYVLFTAEQLNMNPETLRLEFIGGISADDDYYKIAYKYIRNVSLFDTGDMQLRNTFSSEENRKNFILFHS